MSESKTIKDLYLDAAKTYYNFSLAFLKDKKVLQPPGINLFGTNTSDLINQNKANIIKIEEKIKETIEEEEGKKEEPTAEEASKNAIEAAEEEGKKEEPTAEEASKNAIEAAEEASKNQEIKNRPYFAAKALAWVSVLACCLYNIEKNTKIIEKLSENHFYNTSIFVMEKIKDIDLKPAVTTEGENKNTPENTNTNKDTVENTNTNTNKGGTNKNISQKKRKSKKRKSLKNELNKLS